MAVIETWYNQDLQKPVQVQYLDGSLFSHNGNGNLIGVHVFNNGEPVTLGGTVSGYVITADGSTVPCTGTRSGNNASILIPPSAYQPGGVLITVVLTEGSTVTTLAAVTTSVLLARTENQIDPGSVITDWTNTINAAMQEVEDAADNIASIVAAPFSSSTSYAVGDYCTRNGVMYKFIHTHTGSWNSAHVEETTCGDELQNINVTDIPPSAIQMGAQEEQQTATASFHDGYVLNSNGEDVANATYSVMSLATIPEGVTKIIYTTYADPTTNAAAKPFFRIGGTYTYSGVTISNVVQLDTHLYQATATVPENAIAFKTSIYLSEKANSYIKYDALAMYSPLWLELPENSVDKEAIKSTTAMGVVSSLNPVFTDGQFLIWSGNSTSSGSNANMSVARFNVTPGTQIEFTAYSDPATTTQGQIILYDDEDIPQKVNVSVPYYDYISTTKITNTYYTVQMIVPEGFTKAAITMYTNVKDIAPFNVVGYSQKDLDWLSLTSKNFNPTVLEYLAENIDGSGQAQSGIVSYVRKYLSYENLKVVAFGDSITAGVSSGQTTSNFKSYINIVKDAFGWTLTNNAVSGKCITNNDSDSNSISAKVIAYSGNDDLIIIAGGINDYNQNKPLGVITDTTVVTLYGALKSMCDHIKSIGKYAIFITPINCTNRYVTDITIQQIRNAIYDVASMYSFGVIDGGGMPFPTKTGLRQQTLLFDGIHPTEIGHRLLADCVLNALL